VSEIRAAVAGASGRMGHMLVRVLSETNGFVLVGALEAAGHPDLGKDVGLLSGVGENGIPLSADPLAALARADALIDFTVPRVSVELAGLAAQARICHVMGTTGISGDDEGKIRAAARHAVIVKSGNMSLGVTLLAALVRSAVKALPDYDVEIVEMHHKMKVDAPSGTALLLGEAAARARNVALSDVAVRARDGHTGERPDGSIGFSSVRGGTIVGEHDVILAGPHERIVLSHIAEDRAIFARGAVAAARWGQDKKPGLYTMADVLGLSP
jgi:4-hydroxy-tetrahydrodipicolinate reductase